MRRNGPMTVLLTRSGEPVGFAGDPIASPSAEPRR
jgi:hypothetical protein